MIALVISAAGPLILEWAKENAKPSIVMTAQRCERLAEGA